MGRYRISTKNGIDSASDRRLIVLEPRVNQLRDGGAGRRTRRRLRRWSAPIDSIAELAVHAVAALGHEQTKRDERLPQDFLREDALEDRLAAHVDIRLRRRI